MAQANVKYTTSSKDISVLNPLCKALGDPLRIEILKVLQKDAFGVLELCSIFNVGQPAMSHHLKVLSKNSLVSTRRDGTNIFYQRNNVQPMENLQNFHCEIFETINKFKLESGTKLNIQKIKKMRENASIKFFNNNASLFKENQDLIASWSNYGDAIISLLQKYQISGALAFDIGTGLGAFLPKLCSLFKSVIAIDNANKIIKECKNRMAEHNLTNVAFREGDTKNLKEYLGQVDFIALNMVLHHNPDPLKIIKDCATALSSNGHLLITELCSHEQEWAKKSCGDFWLGFEPDTIEVWTEGMQMKKIESVFINQRNGFKTQIHIFKKYKD